MLPIIPYGGAVLAMIISIKNNALRRRKPFELQKDKQKIRTHHPLRYKKVSDKKLKEVNARLLRKIEREDTKRLIIIYLLILVLGSGSIYGVIRYTNRVKDHNTKVAVTRREYNKAKAIEGSLDVESLFEFLYNDGMKWLEKERYKYAKQQFYEACTLKPGNYEANLGLTTAYVNACVKHHIECYTAWKLLESSLKKFGPRPELEELRKTYYEEFPEQNMK